MDDDKLSVPAEQRGRQAIASLVGYVHQLITTVAAWMRLGPDDCLLVEVAEDYAVLAQAALTMTQVKRETNGAALTLRRSDVGKAIVSLWQFSDANPGRDIRLHFLTTAVAGHEQGFQFPEGLTGIAYWARAALGGDVEPLRAFLCAQDWPADLQAFLAEAPPDQLRERIFRRITWLSGADQTTVVLDGLAARLGALALERDMMASDGERALPVLLLRVIENLFTVDRRLTRQAFEKAWEDATTLPVSIHVARQMLGRAVIAGQTTDRFADLAFGALPPRLARRQALVDRLAAIMVSGAVPWIHGSSGLGKSHLAQLLAARSNGVWHVVRLRGLDPAAMRQAFREAVSALDQTGLDGLVLDDLPVPLGEPLLSWVRAIVSEAARLELKVVVTSERAPLAPVGSHFAPWKIEAVAAPYLTAEDVAEIVTAAGGSAPDWAQIVHLTCGAGHPLFVDARIAGLASRGWPRGERLSGLIDSGDVNELEEVRNSVALRLLNELNPDTHTMLLRLSVLIGSFDRNLAMAVAEAYRPLARPGVLFEFLLGPWIEGSGQSRFKLSPLLMSAGLSGLGDAERVAVQTAVIEHLISRRPLPADFLSQLLIQSLATRNLRGLQFIAAAVLTAPDRSTIARACLPLAFLTSREGGRLVPENHGVSASLRLAQVVAVTAEPAHTGLAAVLAEAEAEFAAMPEPAATASRYTMLLMVLASESLEAVPSLWLPRLLEFIALVDGGAVPGEMREGFDAVDLGGLRQDQFFFVLRTNSIADVATLEALFDQLEVVAPDLRRSWLAAGPALLGGPPLFIQSAWSRAALSNALDASTAAAAYRRLAATAEAWGEADVAVECHRAVAVLLDEYLKSQDLALAHLDTADVAYPENTRLARTRATVLAHAERHEEAHRLLASLKAAYSSDEPLERALMLQAAATSAARTGARAEAADLFLEAWRVTDGLSSLAPGVRIGFLCDAIVELGAAGAWMRALEIYADAHLAAEEITNDQTDRTWVAIQAVSQIAQWLNATQEGRSALALADHPGTWSILKPHLPDDRSGAVDLHVGLARAALLENRLDLETGLVARFDAREAAGAVTPLSSLALRGGQIARAVDLRDVPRFLEVLPRIVAASHAGLAAKAAGTADVPMMIPVNAPDQWSSGEAEMARLLASELIAELLLDGNVEGATETAAELGRYAPALAGLLPATHGNVDLAAAAIDRISWLQTPGVPSAAALVQASFTVMQWLSAGSRPTLRTRLWPLVADGWRLVVRIRGAASAAAAPGGPELLQALEDDGGQLASYAALVRAGAAFTGTGLPADVVSTLERMAFPRPVG
ncbi:hypothetical protein [Caulobacter rhizosphaerae]|uniref:hypothetical protein n=1 Tax=Caulobacter rhizosphaerae TaxID=2010972 RepID=UPI0013D08A76|nr:hypothetical protein [Caulobacter rhizosphaerae]